MLYLGTSLGTTFNMVPPRLFQIMSQYIPCLVLIRLTDQEGDGVDDETGQELRPVLPGSVSHLDIGNGKS